MIWGRLVPEQPYPSPDSTEPPAGEGALSAVARGLAEHRGLLYGFGAILAISATCQIVKVDFALYVWIVFAIYLIGSVMWLITRERPRATERAGTDDSPTDGSRPAEDAVRSIVKMNIRARKVKNLKNSGNTHGTVGSVSTNIDLNKVETAENIGNVGPQGQGSPSA